MLSIIFIVDIVIVFIILIFIQLGYYHSVVYILTYHSGPSGLLWSLKLIIIIINVIPLSVFRNKYDDTCRCYDNYIHKWAGSGGHRPQECYN